MARIAVCNCERWPDLLLGRFTLLEGVLMFAHAIEYAQRVLSVHAGYKGGIDGKVGRQTLAAAWRVKAPADYPASQVWPANRHVIFSAQVALAAAGFDLGRPDGLWGVRTDAAFQQWAAKRRGDAMPDRDGESPFGRQAEVERRFGPAGGPQCTAGRIIPPWRMVLAWDTGQVISKIACHVDIAASGQRVLDRIAATHSPVQIRNLGLHLYGGCYNFRPKRGGTSMSMHAYGVALDFDPARNRLTWRADRARLAQPDAVQFWAAWEAERWTSLGRTRNYDWMHVQAPAL